jgi:hypothetical protein
MIGGALVTDCLISRLFAIDNKLGMLSCRNDSHERLGAVVLCVRDCPSPRIFASK